MDEHNGWIPSIGRWSNVCIHHIWDIVEEAIKTLPWKTKKKTKDKDEASFNKTKAMKKLLPPSLEGGEKRGTWALWQKLPQLLKKIRGKKKI